MRILLYKEKQNNNAWALRSDVYITFLWLQLFNAPL